MDKTRVDDMLIEMITPKVKEIEEKFSRGEGLTQDDINTLLLKSQYNHINHLDDKLNETVESVKELRNDFNSLEERLTNNFTTLEQKVSSDFNSLEQRLTNNFTTLEQEVTTDFNSLEQRLTNKFTTLEQKVSSDITNLEQRIETTIQKALNRNMMLLIVVIGFFMTLSKVIDKF